jgi:hypothetical protein
MRVALGGSGQGDDAGDTRIEPLHHALDGTALAGRFSTFEEDHHLELVVDAVLQANQLVLEPEQLAEMVWRSRPALAGRPSSSATSSSSRSLELDFELLVETVGDLGLDALELEQFGGFVGGQVWGDELVVHGVRLPVFRRSEVRFRRRPCDKGRARPLPD